MPATGSSGYAPPTSPMPGGTAQGVFRARSGNIGRLPQFGDLPPEVLEAIGQEALKQRGGGGVPGLMGGGQQAFQPPMLPPPQRFAPTPFAAMSPSEFVSAAPPLSSGLQSGMMPGGEMSPFMRQLLERMRGSQAVLEQSAGPQYPMGPLGGSRAMPGSPSPQQGYQPPRVAGMPTTPAPSQRFPTQMPQQGPYQAINLAQLQPRF